MKTVVKEDFIVVPRREYEEFYSWKKMVKVSLDEKWFWTPAWQSKEAEADKAIRVGKISRSFSDHKKLVSALKVKK